MNIISLIFGLISIFLSPFAFLFSLIGITNGVLYKKRYGTDSIATAGIVTSCIGIAINIMLIVLVALGITIKTYYS